MGGSVGEQHGRRGELAADRIKGLARKRIGERVAGPSRAAEDLASVVAHDDPCGGVVAPSHVAVAALSLVERVGVSGVPGQAGCGGVIDGILVHSVGQAALAYPGVVTASEFGYGCGDSVHVVEHRAGIQSGP